MARRVSLNPCASGLTKWPWRVNLPANISSTGKRERRFFESKREAETFCRQQRIRLENYGRNSSTLTPSQQEQAAIAFEQLASIGVTLNTVVTDFIARQKAKQKSIPFAQLFQRFMDSKKTRSAKYQRDLKYTLPRFSALHHKIVAEMEPGDIDKQTEQMTPSVRNAFLRILRAAFNFGVKRGYLKENPVLRLDFESIKPPEVVTLTPVQTQHVMLAAADTDLLPYNALGLFAGIRPDKELERLEWSEIDLVERYIEITAEVSKTGRRRIVDIEPNLHAWLTYFIANGGNNTGKVTPKTNLRKRLREIRKTAGIPKWTQTVMRHSYASYWLAHHNDINRLTLHMGHVSTDMLKRYLKASKRADAKNYWKILPPKVSRKIVSIAAA